MDVNKYLSRSYFDIRRGRHRAVEVVASDENYVLLKTEEDKILKVCNSDTDADVYVVRIDWLQELAKRDKLNKYIDMPTAKLTGLKHGEFGYVYEQTAGVALDYYIHPSKDIKPFNKWYYDATGGIEYRLKIAYTIAMTLEKIHQNGYCFIDICPRNLITTKFSTDERTAPKTKFVGAENISSYTYHPIIKGHDMYTDPMVFLNRNGNSVVSDTYSYAVMLFELLTTCHPFIGDDCEDIEPHELVEMVNSGELDYIDDDNSELNKNDTFDMTQLFLPKELKELFYKTFVVGKFNPSQRPLLSDYKKACLRAIQKLIVCSNSVCKREYPYNLNKECPFCHKQTEGVSIVRVKRILTSEEKLLLPYDDYNCFSSLPPIEENINYMILKPGLNRLPKSFFDPSFSDDEGFSGLLIQKGTRNYIIRNSFKKTKIKVNGKVLEPFTKKELADKSDETIPFNKEAVIEFPKNLLVHSEKAADLLSEQYGDINYKWSITIG